MTIPAAVQPTKTFVAGGAATTRVDRRRRMAAATPWLAIAVVAGWLLLPQLPTLGGSIEVLSRAEPLLVGAGGVLVALRYGMAAVSLQAAAPAELAFSPTLQVQLASAFVGRFTPEGVGWLVLNTRYLEKTGLARATALTAISFRILVGGLARLAIALIVFAAAGAAIEAPIPPLPPALLVAVPLAGLAAAVAARILRRTRPPAVAAFATAVISLRAALRDPRRLLVLFGSTAALTILSAVVLVTSLAAVGGQASMTAVSSVYLAGTAIAAASPTPGNLGAVELTLTAGLTGIGVPPATAFAGVLLYRLLTFWLPIVPGFLALRSLRKASHL